MENNEMAKRGKNYKKAAEGIDPTKMYSLDEGVELALKGSFTKFDQSVDIAIRLGVDPRHAIRILVFAKGEKEKEALDAGADYAGGDEFVEKIKGGWLEFDRTIATPDMMATVGKIGKILGPRNLMPNAKLGTVTFDIERVVNETKSGKVDFKVDKAGVIHAMLGKASFGSQKVKENVLAFLDKIVQLKPSTSKGVYLKNISLSTTMGPGVKVDPLDIRNLLKQS
jgi:large subunit ribosomal protein L1